MILALLALNLANAFDTPLHKSAILAIVQKDLLLRANAMYVSKQKPLDLFLLKPSGFWGFQYETALLMQLAHDRLGQDRFGPRPLNAPAPAST